MHGDKKERERTNKAKKSSTFRNTSAKQVSEFKDECIKYETVIKEAEEGEDILEWWSKHQAILPLLSYMARVLFAVPASSSKSERVFSVAGNVVTAKRARLDPEKVEDLVILKTNVPILRQMGMRK